MYKKERDEAMREQLLTEIIRKYGFEAEATIYFARLCKKLKYCQAAEDRIYYLYLNLITRSIEA